MIAKFLKEGNLSTLQIPVTFLFRVTPACDGRLFGSR